MFDSLPANPERIDEKLSKPSKEAVSGLRGLEGPVAVLGAGGKMGLHMAAMLRRVFDEAGRVGEQVFAVSRFGSPESRVPFDQFGVDTISADLSDEAALSGLPDFQTIYFLAGVKFGTSGDPNTLRRFNEEMPARVAARFPHARIAAFSTGCVYPVVAPSSGGSCEEDAPEPTGDYAVSCLQRERAFTTASHHHGTSVVLIRLNYAVEFRYGVLVDIAQRVMSGQPVDVTMGWVNVIWQRDAVDYSLRAITLAESPATILNVAGLPIISVRELAERFGARLGRAAIITGAEEPTAWLNNAARAHSLFGPPEVTLEQAIEWTAEWVRNGGATLGKPTKFEKRDGKF
jgi:nucleoside-diphosphate-sugar epimerase